MGAMRLEAAAVWCIMVEDECGLNRSSSDRNFRIGKQGPIALRCGVSEDIAASQPRWLATLEGQGGLTEARDHYAAGAGVQEPELLDDQEQEDDDGTPGVLEVLQVLPEAHGPQRNQVGLAVQAIASRGPIEPSSAPTGESAQRLNCRSPKPNFSVRIRAPPPSTIFVPGKLSGAYNEDCEWLHWKSVVT